MNLPLHKIISDHRRIGRQKGRQPKRLVEVWTDSLYRSSKGRITLVVTSFDLFSSLFGDCAYVIFSGLKTNRSVNEFQISSDLYTSFTHSITQYLIVKKCSRRAAFRDVTPKLIKLLNKLAYEITVSRVWKVKKKSLDPVYNPNRPSPSPEIKNEALMYFQSLSPYLIKDVIGIILTYSIDISLPNHLRCSKETKDEIRCNQLSVSPLRSCLKHKYQGFFLSNHY
jgi:hypothetical protein